MTDEPELPRKCPCCAGSGKNKRSNTEPTETKGPDGKRVWRTWTEVVDCGYCKGKGYYKPWRDQ